MDELKLKRVVMAATLRCNLRCKLCFPKAPQLLKPWHPTKEYLFEEIDRVFSVIDSCGRLDFSGGEPLARNDMGEIVQYALKYSERIDGGVRIIVNGAIVPSGELLAACRESGGKSEFLVDNYGPGVSNKLVEIGKALNENGIRHEIRNPPGSPHCGGWVDLGIEGGKRNTLEKAAALFSKCTCSNELRYAGAIEEGRQYACKMSKLVSLGGWEPEDATEYVDYMDTDKSREQLRGELRNLYNREYLPACLYCNGFFNHSPRFAPGEQLTDGELAGIKKY